MTIPQPEAASAFLAAVIENSDDAIITKDLNGVITSWNKSAERLFGYTEQEAVGRPILILIPPNRQVEEPLILDRIRRGERVDHFETVRVRKDGTLIDVSLTISPVKSTDGRIIGVSKIARDITERKRTQEALRNADRRKDEFLAMLAHELRNPLAPIGNAIEILRRSKGDREAIRVASETLQRQVGHLVRLVDDLLDISRISRGKIELHKECIDVRQLIEHAVETTGPARECMGHELTVTLPSAPVYLFGDPVRLAQVVGNLLGNACKFTDRGGRIWLTVEREREHVVIRVRDSGIGIERDQLRRIFEMFTQVDQSLERARWAGTGADPGEESGGVARRFG